MHTTGQNNELTPKPGQTVYHLDAVESTIIDYIRDRSIIELVENFEAIYTMAAFDSRADHGSTEKDALSDMYFFLDILKGRHEQVRVWQIRDSKKSD